MKIEGILTNEIQFFFPTDKVLLSELIQAAEEGIYCELYLYLSVLSLLPFSDGCKAVLCSESIMLVLIRPPALL